MSGTRMLIVGGAAVTVAVLVSGCGPPGTGTIGVGVDAAGKPVAYLRVCPGEHMDLARLDAEPLKDSTPSVGAWGARPAVTGSTSWSFDRPDHGWVAKGPAPQLEPGVIYSLSAGAKDGSGTSGYVTFTTEDLQAMKPGQVRIYDTTREVPAAEPTGTLEQQDRDENDNFMRVVSQHQFEQASLMCEP
ncbi:hypothetical protein [Actinopolymorpha rutila]|uniref:Lipoprotein n=1 Tax=Actinopolymorpha rutila TaxID=446787 RepID=A0A852ZU79_9ACTN|nr:hypothetical protein [Actinopolymorpha rutila]NYH92889.1 hypothetical protein [Actinopolymorpha rutila]